MANLNVSYGEMRDAATRLSTGQEDITTTLHELKGFIEGLVSSGFVTDQASVAFGEAYRKFSHGATELIGGLSSLGDYLRKASDALEDTDKQLAAALRG
ncbi:WXG100 family type VII secretion target [Cellulomonas edaphi]|uniref:WXG100 family type VII secretion target n=1 Tax=Cellulomonas edaphi TaxID=3053468 RepID=A0ABT7S3L9_9CELL|nr:WXG100 family type VII secretion target [Cellulomons edaphi]MDM7830221.1 WXG100 family type VII secretion target [Cellulomons edaphi]